MKRNVAIGFFAVGVLLLITNVVRTGTFDWLNGVSAVLSVVAGTLIFTSWKRDA
jgi:hypothetical protein